MRAEARGWLLFLSFGAVFIATLVASPRAHAAKGRKTANIWLNPAGAVFHYMNGGIDFAAGNLTIGPTAGVFSKSTDSESMGGTAYGLRFNYYANKGKAISSGPRGSLLTYVSPMTARTSIGEAQLTNLIVQGLGGYQVLWGWFSFAAGAGLTYYSAGSELEYNQRKVATPAFHGIGFALELMIACTF